jgi:protein disulfide-isomerase
MPAAPVRIGSMSKLLCAGLLAVVLASFCVAGEVGVGSTRDEVIARYGQPQDVMSAGTREVLVYPRGRVSLVNGIVTRINLPPGPAPVQASAPALPIPNTTTPAARRAPAPFPRDKWFVNFEAAKAEATATRRRLLVLFTGSDWCPGCIKFEGEVANNPDFLSFTSVSFVLLRLDYPRELPQPPELREQNRALRKRFDINIYPSLLILDADGNEPVKVDFSKPRQAENYADFFVQAIDEARHLKPGEADKKWWWPF